MNSPTMRELKLPSNFNPTKHARQIEMQVKEKFGDDWEVSHFNPTRFTVVAVRKNTMMQVNNESEDQKYVSLAKGTKDSDGPRLARKLENMYPGFVMTQFEPALDYARVSALAEDTIRAREAIAGVLRVKPWEVQITKRADEGFDFVLPQSYNPSKHFAQIDEVAKEIVGHEGWYADINAQRLTGSLNPSDPPTFPAGIPYPMDKTTIVPTMKLDVGAILPEPGQTELPTLSVDFSDAMAQVGGLAGSGKSVFLNDLIASALAAGWELAIIDIPAKAVDFEWCKPFVRPNGWGADSIQETVACLGNLYDEGQRRAKLLKQYHAKKLAELPEDVRAKNPPILVVVDEATGLFAKETIPKSLPKDHPMRVEAEEQNIAVDMLKSYINKIAAELRFVGLRQVVSTQVASRDTGIDTKLRTNLHHKFLLGANPTEANRKLIFPNADVVPLVPANVANDAKASRGVGSVQPEGAKAAVFKPYYADTDALVEYLRSLGVKEFTGQKPSAALVDQYMPTVGDDDGGESQSVKNRKAMHEAAMTDPETGEKMSAFEYANKQRAASVRKSEADALSGETA